VNIYVGNLSFEVTEDDLRREFVVFGLVTSISLMSDRDIGSGQGRKCGYVEMPSVREGESAIERLQGTSLKGRKLDIIKALPVTHNLDLKLNGNQQVLGFHRKTR
jgi:RNA recognition motif-containing protein